MSFEYKKFSSNYNRRFEQMRKAILKLASNELAIEHIGSTSVVGLGGKGIVDISVGIKKWNEAKELLKILKKLGFKHFHDVENHSLFVSTRSRCEDGDFHIHISRVGTKRYMRTIAFRDYLRKNPKVVRKYAKMKMEAFNKSKGNRDMYKKLKNQWFLKLAEKSRLWD
jgi:GrpB-like predicted nucleotidyltransferase (UPF0157 family)